MRCPHCKTSIAGPGLPAKAEPGMLCPLCHKDLSAKPETWWKKVLGTIAVVIMWGLVIYAMVWFVMFLDWFDD